MFYRLNKKLLKPGDKWVAVTEEMFRPYFAVVLWLNPEGKFVELWEACSTNPHEIYAAAQEEAYWYAAEHSMLFDLPGFIEPESPL